MIRAHDNGSSAQALERKNTLSGPVQELLSGLVGLPVSHAWNGYGSALFLEFGALQQSMKRDGSPRSPQGEMSLMIEWSWRIEDERSILCGSWSDEELWHRVFATLSGSRVSQVDLFGKLPEIHIGLSNGLQVLSFMTAEGFPAWTLFDRRHAQERWLGVEENGLRITAKA